MQNTFLFVLVVGVATAVAIFRLKYPRKRKLDFIPDPNNRKRIATRGWKEEEFRKIITDFQAQYRDYSLNITTSFEQTANDILRVNFPGDIPDKLFPFLVNYAQYPRDFDLKNRSVLVIGKAPVTATLDAELNAEHSGEDAFLYSPANDTRYDQVFFRVGSKTFILPFTFGGCKETDDARLPEEFDTLASFAR